MCVFACLPLTHACNVNVCHLGWWTIVKILHQAEDMLDVLRVVAPPRLYQYIPYYDNSATHNKREDLTLATSKLNAKWGGKQAGLRDSELVQGCIGPNAAIMWHLPGQGTAEWEGGHKWVREGTAGAVIFNCNLKVRERHSPSPSPMPSPMHTPHPCIPCIPLTHVPRTLPHPRPRPRPHQVGDIDTGTFKDTDPPPFYDLRAQRFDRDMTAAEVIVERARSHSNHFEN